MRPLSRCDQMLRGLSGVVGRPWLALHEVADEILGILGDLEGVEEVVDELDTEPA